MCQSHFPRRRFIGRLAAGGLALSPLAAALSACSRPAAWPEGMAAIDWGRDTCTRCRMVIADRRFAVEVRGGPKDEVFKFDDIGCAAVWLMGQDWRPEARIWVADGANTADKVAWLNARKAHYLRGSGSPMGYNFVAVPAPQSGSLEFGDMVEAAILKSGL